MSTFQRHNAPLQQKLTLLVKGGKVEELRTYLQSLSSSYFRTAGFLLAETVLPTCEPNSFWTLFVGIVPTNAKAYLGTFLKAATKLYAAGKLSLDPTALQTFANTASVIDKQKVLQAFLPIIRQHEEVKCLVDMFYSTNEQVYALLIRAGTLPCYYVLFNLLKTSDDSVLIRHVAITLLKKGDGIAYNLVSIIKHYFGVEDLPAQLSLKVETYELSRLDTSYEKFVKTLTK